MQFHYVSCWHLGTSTCFDCYPPSNVKNLNKWVEYPSHIKKTSELSLLYANRIKILLFGSIYSSALYCWIPKTARITDTHKAALHFVFPLGETQQKHKNRKEKYSLGLSICILPELWVPDQSWVTKLPLLAGISNKRVQIQRGDGS